MNISEKIKQKLKRNGKLGAKAAFKARITPGYNVFKRIMTSKDCNEKMFLCPYAGTGDVYLASMYMNAFAKANEIENFVVVVIGNANFKIASLFGFKRVVKISQEDADYLIRLVMFLGEENDRIVVMHHHPPQMHCGILENMRNINKINFTDLFLTNVFHLDLYKDKQLPQFNYSSPQINDLFIKNNLIEGKTVILSPYVNTLSGLPWWVWVNIAQKLKDFGFVVCTNCGTPSEQPINGTIPLYFGYDISVPMLEKCGYFVGIRSGFCDVVSSAACKKIIIYQPYLFWGAGTNYDYFSLNKIGFCNDAIEFEYEGVEFYDLIDRVINYVIGH